MKDIIFFDLETTGVDTSKDRIVSMCSWKLDADFQERVPIKTHLINPGIPIPPEASAVHGITDEMVKDAPTFAQLANGMFDFYDGCDYAGFNIINFDVPLLSEEFDRVGKSWPRVGSKFVDAHKIFAAKERRDLSGAAYFYLGEKHEDAHDATADVKMTVAVFKAQRNRYADLTDIDAIDKISRGEKAVDIAGKLEFNENGDIVYAFGKDKGKVVRDNPGFGRWMLGQSFPRQTKFIVDALVNAKVNG